MTKGYQFISDYGDSWRMKEHDSHEHLGADYVLASDYAALEAERDDWMRRCQNLVEAMRHHGYSAESLARIAEGYE